MVLYLRNVLAIRKNNLTKMKKKISYVSQITQVISMASLKFQINSIKEQQNEYIHIIEPSDLKQRPIVAGPICLLSPFSD